MPVAVAVVGLAERDGLVVAGVQAGQQAEIQRGLAGCFGCDDRLVRLAEDGADVVGPVLQAAGGRAWTTCRQRRITC